MFKTSRKKVVAGKEKVEFKLEFHASQVPQRGWDKLLVSLISLESGKVTSKTGKASVKNGNCYWPEPIYESANLSQDLKGKNADKQIYRIVVSMGLSRFGLLGETTINLMDHLQANFPVSLSLPLQNCNVGSILHVKIQRIMSESASRRFEDLKEIAPAQDLSMSKHDDSLQAGYDFKPPVAQTNDKLQHNKIEKASNLSTSIKDDSFPQSTHRYSSDSLDIPSTPGVSESRPYGRDPLSEEPMSPSSSISSTSGRQESSRGFHDYLGFKRTQINQEFNGELPPAGANKLGKSAVSHSLLSVQSSSDGNDDRETKQWNSSAPSMWGLPENSSSDTLSRASEIWEKNQESGRKNIYLQGSSLESAEMTIRELKTEAASQEQYGKRLETQIEELKQQLVEETRKRVELQTQLTDLVAERDSFKQDIENLKSSEKAVTKTGESVVWQQVEDSRYTVKELQDELEYQKSVNTNLSLQLRKTQESNSELLLEIQDLEKEIADTTRELEKHRNLTQPRAESVRAHADSEKIIDALKKELEELEKDSQEVTEENLELLSQLKQANNVIAKLESDNTALLEQSHSPSLHAYKVNASSDLEETEESNLRRMVHELREKLRNTEESTESKLASSRTLIDDLNSSVGMLRSKNALLERQHQSFEENISDLLKEIDALKSKSNEHEREKSLFVSQSRELKALHEKATKTDQDYKNILKRCQEQETMNQGLIEEKRKAIDFLVQELNSTEEQALDENKYYTDISEVVEDLKSRKLEFETSLISKVKEEAEMTLIQLQEKNVLLQEQFQQEQLKNSQLVLENRENDAKSAKLLQELYACQNEVQKMEQNTKALETIRNEMEVTVQGIQEENRHSRSQVKELEMQIVNLNEDGCLLRESRSALEARNQDLQSSNIELCKKLDNAREEASWARENTNSLLTEIRSLEAEIESDALRRTEMEQSVSELDGKNVALRSQLQNLSNENLSLTEKVVEYEAQYRNALEEMGALTTSVQDKEIARKKAEASLQVTIKEQQDKIQQLEEEIAAASREAEERKAVARNLSSAVDDLKSNLASKESSIRNNEEELQKLREECTISAVKITVLTDELHKLRNDIQEKEKGLLVEIQSLLVSKKDMQTRIEETEEMLCCSYREKAIAEERLHKEIELLTSSCEDKEKMAMQALTDGSIVRSEKEELEKMLERANEDALSLKNTLELKITEALAKESQIGKDLEDVLGEVYVLKKEKLSYTRKMVELESKCTVLEEQKETIVSLQMENEKSRMASATLKQEKMNVEASFKEALEELSTLKEQIKSQEEVTSRWKQSKASLEDKILRLQEENTKAAKGPVDEKSESNKLRKHASDLKRKLAEQELQREELKRSVTALEEELKQKTNALNHAERKLKDREVYASTGNPVSLLSRSLSRANSKVGPMSPSRDAKELFDLRQKVKLLEVEMKKKATEVEASKHHLQEQQLQFSSKIEALELANEQLVKEHSHSNVDRLVLELTNLQDQNAALFQRENELLSKLGSQQLLQKELENLKEEKKDLENALSIFSEAVKGENVMKRVSMLETELAEVLEANNMYKLQLQSVFSKQHNVNAAALENLCSADKVITDLAELKSKNELLEEELKDMQQRYFKMSLQFAEVEAEREELVMTIRNIRGTKKLVPFWSANFQRDNGNF